MENATTSSFAGKGKVLRGVRIIAILNYVLAALALFLGLLFLGVGFVFYISVDSFNAAAQAGAIQLTTASQGHIGVGTTFLWFGAVFIILALCLGFLGRNLVRRKNGARIGEAVFAVLVIFFHFTYIRGNVTSIIYAITIIVLHGWIIFYLLADKKVREEFSHI